MDFFLNENFLLQNQAAQRLYFDYASKMPIFDYHCHIPALSIAQDRSFENLTQAWLDGDLYKWRAMRLCGISEHYISGHASDYDKFIAWAETIPKTVGNPIYLWSHMELRHSFGIYDLLSPTTADAIWNKTRECLATKGSSARSLMQRAGVKALCTTDDPTDSLQFHEQLANDHSFSTLVLPAFRTDMLFAADHPEKCNQWINQLEHCSGIVIDDWGSLIEALEQRHFFFHKYGCRIADYGLERVYAAPWTPEKAQRAFAALRTGQALHGQELEMFRSALLYSLMAIHCQEGWVQQLHLGVIHNINTLANQKLGEDTGFDCVGDAEQMRPLTILFDALERKGLLGKTIIYPANPKDTTMIASALACYTDGMIPGKIQLGNAWWFCSHQQGIREQLDILSSVGLLSQSVGMATDSHNMLSYPRHEYFRRIVCQKIGEEMLRGELPYDFSLLGTMLQDICYTNAVRFFDIDGKDATFDNGFV